MSGIVVGNLSRRLLQTKGVGFHSEEPVQQEKGERKKISSYSVLLLTHHLMCSEHDVCAFVKV